MEYKDIKDDCVYLVVDALQNIDIEYFEIMLYGTNDTKKRERVFCYELYHQMRKIQERRKLQYFIINGEINKAGHPKIIENFDPDFVIHKQGEMKNNQAVIEVKRAEGKEGILKDFETIKRMVHCYDYKIGIFLITGVDLDWFDQEIWPELKDPDLLSHKEQIYVICKKEHRSELEIATLHELGCK